MTSCISSGLLQVAGGLFLSGFVLMDGWDGTISQWGRPLSSYARTDVKVRLENVQSDCAKTRGGSRLQPICGEYFLFRGATGVPLSARLRLDSLGVGKQETAKREFVGKGALQGVMNTYGDEVVYLEIAGKPVLEFNAYRRAFPIGLFLFLAASLMLSGLGSLAAILRRTLAGLR